MYQNQEYKPFSYKILQELAVLSETGNIRKELNLIQYGTGKPRLDLRNWQYDADGTRHFLKGITMSHDELATLKKVLNNISNL